MKIIIIIKLIIKKKNLNNNPSCDTEDNKSLTKNINNKIINNNKIIKIYEKTEVKNDYLECNNNINNAKNNLNNICDIDNNDFTNNLKYDYEDYKIYDRKKNQENEIIKYKNNIITQKSILQLKVIMKI